MFRVPITTSTSGSGGSEDGGDCYCSTHSCALGKGKPTVKE